MHPVNCCFVPSRDVLTPPDDDYEDDYEDDDSSDDDAKMPAEPEEEDAAEDGGNAKQHCSIAAVIAPSLPSIYSCTSSAATYFVFPTASVATHSPPSLYRQDRWY